MARRLGVLFLVAIAAGLVGCSSSAGPDAADTLDDYWIECYYCYFPDGVRELNWRSCVVRVFSGGADGDPVSGLDVTCNGQVLQFTSPSYFADVTGIQPGEEVTFEVSDGSHLLSLTLEVPDSPAQLGLAEGAWNFSPPAGSHTLMWTNPGVTADSVFVSIGGQGAHPLDVHIYSERLPAAATQVVLNNAEMSDFVSTTELSCSVSQGTRGVFASHSGGSEVWARAAVVRSWER